MEFDLKNLFVLLCIITTYSLGEQLECDYIKHSDGYNCEMKSVFEQNKELTSVIGEHKFGKNDTDVEVFFITDSSKTQYVPSKACSIFKKLTKIDIYASLIVELKKEIFDECSTVQKVVIKYIKLKILEEDLLTYVENLESFVLGFTHVETLPQKFFSNNKKLKSIDLSFNKLKVITTEFPSSLISLSLMNNECIDGHFDSRALYFDSINKSLNKLIMETYKKCAPNRTAINSNETSYEAIKMMIIEEQINDNEKKLTFLETELEDTEAKLNKKILDNEDQFKVFKLEMKEKTDDIAKHISELEKTSNDQNEKFLATSNQLKAESSAIKLKLEKNEDLKKMSGDLRAEINQNENLLVTLFCFQLVMIAAAIFFGVYKNCYSNRNNGARLVNDQTNPNF